MPPKRMSVAVTPLRRILGLGFGLAMVFGGTVGAGILRLPGTLAGALGNAHLIELFWILGGAYALLGAVSVAELAAMMPEAGGFYVYARRAFGPGVGFVIGWSDWLNEVAALSYAAITSITFLGILWPPANAMPRVGAIAVIAVFTAIHCLGLKTGSTLTRFISSTVGLMLLVLVAACFFQGAQPAPAVALPASAAALPLGSLAMLGVIVTALRAVFVTYDGWYSAVYLAEESTQPAQTLPRALIGGTLLVIALYVLINVAILRVVPLRVMAASQLPAADAARLVLPRGGAELVTVISLLTVLSLVNAVMLITPRIVFAMGRDGLFTQKAAGVSAGGTPRMALLFSSAAAAVMILTGSFEQIIALAAVLFLFAYISAYAAVFVLRRREPDSTRPYRAFGYPWTTGTAMIGCVSLLVAAVLDDPHSGLSAAVLLASAAAVYARSARRRS